MKKLILAVCVLFSLSFTAFAGNTITVANSNDTGAGSLRDAVTNVAVAGDTIRFASSTYGDTIKLTSGQIDIGINLMIIGLGDDSTIISGTNSSRIFEIASGDTVGIRHLALAQGMVADSGGAVYNNGSLSIRYCDLTANSALHGGAILSKSGLSLLGCVFTGNSATSGFGGAVFSLSGNLSAIDCEFQSNTALTGGGAIASTIPGILTNLTVNNNTSNAGGGLYLQNNFTITNSTFSSNNANSGDGGGIYNTGSTKITGSTFTSNRVNNANFSGGAVFSNNAAFVIANTMNNNFSAGNGGAISSTGAWTVVNSTLSNNQANGGNGGGINSAGEGYVANSTLSGNEADGQGGGIASSASLVIERTTITDNHAGGNGGGIYSADSLQFSNTIVGGNNGDGQGPEIFNAAGTPISLGHNLVSDNSQADFNTASGDIVGTSGTPVDVFLAPLSNNGGVSLTHLPLCNSPAINAGDSTGAPLTDQTGNTRVYAGIMDIGSVEAQTEPVTIDAIITDESTAGAADGSIQSVVTGGATPYVYEWSTGSNQPTINNLVADPYALTVTDNEGCRDSAVFTVSLVDGIFDVQQNMLSVYPNPVYDFFTVEFENTVHAATLEILDINGKTISTFPLSGGNQSFHLNVKELPAGNYLLKMIDGEKISVGKFLKK